MAVTTVEAGTEGTAACSYDFLLHLESQATKASQGLGGAGKTFVYLPSHTQPILSCQDGPGRLLSSLVRVIMSELPPDFMLPEVIQVLLDCGGYTFAGAEALSPGQSMRKSRDQTWLLLLLMS